MNAILRPLPLNRRGFNPELWRAVVRLSNLGVFPFDDCANLCLILQTTVDNYCDDLLLEKEDRS